MMDEDILTKPLYEEREEELLNILESLYKNQTELRGNEIAASIEKLTAVYSDHKFRHMYSRFYSFIRNLSNDERNLFSSNISAVFQKSQELMRNNGQIDINTANSIAKLYDHINIELARVSDEEAHKEAENNLEIKTREAQRQLNSIQEQLSETEKALDKSRFDIVAVLGIFSAIIIAFFGGFNYITAALTALNESSILNIILVVSIAGSVVFNTIVSVLSLAIRNTNFSEEGRNTIRMSNFFVNITLSVLIIIALLIKFLA